MPSGWWEGLSPRSLCWGSGEPGGGGSTWAVLWESALGQLALVSSMASFPALPLLSWPCLTFWSSPQSFGYLSSRGYYLSLSTHYLPYNELFTLTLLILRAGLSEVPWSLHLLLDQLMLQASQSLHLLCLSTLVGFF